MHTSCKCYFYIQSFSIQSTVCILLLKAEGSMLNISVRHLHIPILSQRVFLHDLLPCCCFSGSQGLLYKQQLPSNCPYSPPPVFVSCACPPPMCKTDHILLYFSSSPCGKLLVMAYLRVSSPGTDQLGKGVHVLGEQGSIAEMIQTIITL